MLTKLPVELDVTSEITLGLATTDRVALRPYLDRRAAAEFSFAWTSLIITRPEPEEDE